MSNPLEATARLREIVTDDNLEAARGDSEIYREAKTLVDGLEEICGSASVDPGYTSEKLTKLRWHIDALAGIDDGNDHPSSQHRVWARTALTSLESSSCFGLN